MKTSKSYKTAQAMFCIEDFTESEMEEIKEICAGIDAVVDPELCSAYTMEVDRKTGTLSFRIFVDDITLKQDDKFGDVCNKASKIKISTYEPEEDDEDLNDLRNKLDVELTFCSVL